MTRSDLVARILPGVLAARWADQEFSAEDAIMNAETLADAAIESGAVTVTDTPDLGASDIEQAIEHLRKARAAFVLAGRENDAESVREAIGKVAAMRLEIGFPAEPANGEG